MALDDPVVWILILFFLIIIIIVWAISRSRRKSKQETRRASEYPPYPPPLHTSEKIIERQVIKIPCRYCKSLIDPVQDKKCPNCGAPVM